MPALIDAAVGGLSGVIRVSILCDALPSVKTVIYSRVVIVGPYVAFLHVLVE